MKVNKTNSYTRSGWTEAAAVARGYLKNPSRADVLLADARPDLDAREFATCQRLFYGVLRNLALLRRAIDLTCEFKPLPEAEALMMVAGYEFIEDGTGEEMRAKITHHAVEMAHEILPEKMYGFVNAVLRKLPDALVKAVESESDPVKKLALKYSHPSWLVRRWAGEFGIENTQALLEWDQKPSPVYLRIENGVEKLPDNLKPTQWAGYFSYEGGSWADVEALLKAKTAYAQDPATRLCVDLLSPKAGEGVLDLCSAPGGKARNILSRMNGSGTLVCVDLPGIRCSKLRDNISGVSGARVEVIEIDVLKLGGEVFKSRNLPESYDAVLLDAPCSNTGVLRRRPDARWRLQDGDIEKSAALQEELLEKASQFVSKGGRIVYSTCSVGNCENDGVVAAFLAKHPEFEKSGEVKAFPWKDNHDGAAAACMRRK
jgi:16S rRNA (cytosine967-C5)-methyltransferase